MDEPDFSEQVSALERLQLREARRGDPARAKPPEVRTLDQIRTIIADFAPERQIDGRPVQLTARLVGELEGGGTGTFSVSAPTQSRSLRSMLLDGLAVLERQNQVQERAGSEQRAVEVNGVSMSPPSLVVEDPVLWIDPLIVRWFGGQRRGFDVCWELDDGYTYKYNVRGHKLSRFKRP